ncbi:MAG: DUF502 domain-containing protein [Candidatus Dadabacteria bacterium]|nr:DUF502 domain-containing protein [Candidatus Dadabacteria bacterium]MCY4042196.1 DUF502 domain-containing protein [Candidatus Dadabacteria bacterium]MCY4047567.1 DUF502 domain-containing protein [Candidatus Dadabacteria bacterium]
MRFFNWIKTGFITGLAVIVPFGLVLFFLYSFSLWIYSLVSAVPARLLAVSVLHTLPEWVFKLISFSIGVFFTVFLVVLAGYVTRNIIGNRLVKFFESIVLSIPVVRTAYNASKQIVKTLSAPHAIRGGRGVVVFEYPKEGIYSIGFLMGRMKPGERHNVLDETMVNIFLPTTPNPTSGFYLMVPESKVKQVPMSVEQAFNVIISGGLSSSPED